MSRPFEWVRASNGAIPSNALAQGVEHDGQPLYIARAFFKGGLHPGKAAPHLANGGFAMGWGGRTQQLNEYFVLCGDVNRAQWLPAHGPVTADRRVLIEAGHEANGERLYVARANVDNSQQLGKAGTHLGGMSFSYGGAERGQEEYMVLAYRQDKK
ncbi:hypothetical protein GGI04_003396 [Coemansia thaxteri]|uniref:DUF3421 domain-containing protein n=1 Tax=Coemansia thaxteri TaxID=2663907 RepID=A0A9W8BIA4_9FUNG|nr:hypothetical protein GGI04_003396 [Coemansia thaxteri]KAJ2002953.1 hypothetical protein H4R26_003335 [Coemansia thaxteri]KAJ2467963.1 hypothetical protein GGI02_003849 [Coemansia sp. RSA 2322]KAJ2484883.1 hypothetical protein EV174_002100 [Coemansia sp. RSA 2320]